jgi:hypothetical protein
MPSIIDIARESFSDAASAPVRSWSTIVTLAFMFAAITCVGSLAINAGLASSNARRTIYDRLEVAVAPSELAQTSFSRDLQRYWSEIAAVQSVGRIVPEVVVPMQLELNPLQTAAPTFVESYDQSQWASAHCAADGILLGAEFAAIHKPDRHGYVTVYGNQLPVCGVRDRRYDVSDLRASVGPAMALRLLRQVVPANAPALPGAGTFNVFSIELSGEKGIADMVALTGRERNLLFADPRPQVRMSESAAGLLRSIAAGVAVMVGLCCFVITFNSATSSVMERRPELGIRRAVGARRRDVLAALVVECNVLCFAACVGGVAIVLAATALLEAVLSRVGAGGFFVVRWPALVAGAGGLFAVLDCAVILPAIKASRMTVIDALRR